MRWSPLHPHAFLTAGADWTVRLWDSTAPDGQVRHHSLQRSIISASEIIICHYRWTCINHLLFLLFFSAQSVLELDLGAPVGDAAWAHHSSTILAAATENGKIAIFDLSSSTVWPLCKQKVVQKARLTKLAFNPRHPVLLVGDDK